MLPLPPGLLDLSGCAGFDWFGLLEPEDDGLVPAGFDLLPLAEAEVLAAAGFGLLPWLAVDFGLLPWLAAGFEPPEPPDLPEAAGLAGLRSVFFSSLKKPLSMNAIMAATKTMPNTKKNP
ncbi:MAG: hypothetical protein FWF71_03030 [Actinomycetia bacterium]|nr:hypothetical protein [Actinomycetes bacterium]